MANVFEEPTKESTSSSNFTHSGWSMTPYGSNDTSALKSVIEDRIVYATFVSSARYYTVRFYDGDVLLDTMQVKYGETANYTAEKEGFGFDGWQPSNENITADTDCYAQWTENVTFANASWE